MPIFDLITAIGAIATPLLLAGLSFVGWQLRRKIDRRIELENRLRSERIAIYNDIIEPFIIFLMSDTAWEHDRKNKGKDKFAVATAKLLSLDYRRRGFQLSLMGSDSVVKAYNELFQLFYIQGEGDQSPSHDRLVEMLERLGHFLLEVRRSMGNEATTLERWDMIDWWLKDARKLRSSAV